MFCSFIDFLTEPFVFVFLLLDLHPRETIRRVYAHFRKASDGCDGSTGFGFYGFLNVRSLFLIFQALGVREKKLVDLGAGDGKVLASAMRCNARSVVGYELPSNSAHKYIYDAVLRRVFPNPIQHNQIKPMAQWLAKDIDKVFFVVWSRDYQYLSWNFYSDRCSSRRHGYCLFILEWYAPRNPNSRSRTILQLQICPQTRSVSRRQLE